MRHITNTGSKVNLDVSVNMTHQPERVILILSPCRSGSSALLNAFAMTGVPSTFQPIKASIRRALIGDRTPVNIEVTNPTLVIKETLGPYFPEEVHYDPVRTLTDKFNLKSLTLIALLRTPEDCYNSWKRSFTKKEGYTYSIDLFNQAYHSVLTTYLEARAAKMPAVAIKSEDIGNRDTLSKALSIANITFLEEMIDWEKSSHHTPNTYGFQKPHEPEYFKVSGILDGVKNGAGLVQSTAISSNGSNKIVIAQEAYETFLKHCIL